MPKLEYSDLLKWFNQGEKPSKNWKIGTEHEKFVFYTNNFKRVSYLGASGISELLNALAIKNNWVKIIENNNTIGLKDDTGASISLEPGGQLELSGTPLENLHQTCKETGQHLKIMKEVMSGLGLSMVGVGYDPKWARSDISFMPKGRYEIMKNYMPKVGQLGLDMMLRTCTIQVNLDFSSEKDMVEKFQISMALQSVATALFANSPFIEGKPSGYLSSRAMVWTDTDPYRTGVPEIVFDSNFGYESWLNYVLEVPMYFVYRDGKYIDVAGNSFVDFMEGKLKGFEGQYPTIKDWEDHITVAFPEVRLKQYLEMRGADGGPWNIICALPALWVGLLYDSQSQSDALSLAKPLMDANILEEGRVSAATFALNGKIGNVSIDKLASDMLDISRDGLKRRNKIDARGLDESQFLDPLFYILDNKQTGAEKLLQKFNGSWNKNIDKIFIENSF
ncbi:MAG: glutamate--cysteine ligase [Proteobacteria bacterium]|nr:glutamate--cysteine ligase [Pseudomonadota bacterium]MDA1135880.1 glutamate--cysteine ligase [Pseudomonadota bacterium]